MIAQPEEVAAGFAEAWNSADPDALAALFAEDADFVNVVGLWWNTRARIRESHAYGFRYIFPNAKMVLSKVTTRQIGADAAVVHAAWTLTGQVTPAGEPAGRRRGVFSFTLARQGSGGWLCASAQNTERIPGSETLLASQGSVAPASYRLRKD